MKLNLNIWRQKSSKDKGHFEKYVANDVTEEMSFLEMLDVVNEDLVLSGKEPVAFDHDCREGICGSCSMVINPVVRDLIVDRSAFDRVITAGGYISVSTGNAQDANATPIAKVDADEAFMSAACIGCGACVAACKNASASLFVAAKTSHLGMLPQGSVEQKGRVKKMVAQMDAEGFGACTNTGSCSAACPKGISLDNIARLNRDLLKSNF